MDEKDIERGLDTQQQPQYPTEKAEESPIDASEGGGEGFGPIRTAAAAPTTPRPLSRASRNSRGSLSRERSNNGYGCDDLAEDSDNTNPSDSSAQQQEKDPFEVGWEGGDNDPMCPRSMPTWRKWVIIGITSFGSFCVTNASSIYTTTYAQMDAEFHNSRIIATLGLSTFVLGIALGPFWSPLAEFYGRRPIYLAAFAAYLIWIIPSAVSQNIQTMIVARFFQGLAGSAFLSVSGGTVGDLFDRKTMQAPMAIFTLAPFIGPSTGPLIGGFINYNVYWRWTHYFLIIWSFVLFVSIAVLVPETYHPVLLKAKAQRIRAETGDGRYKAPMEKSTKSIPKTVAWSLLRPFQLLIFEPMCLVLDIYAAVLLGILYLFFGAFPLVFINNHGFNLWQVGLTFLGLFCAMVIAVLSTPIWHHIRDYLPERRQRLYGGELKSEPEDQLPSVIFGAPLITGGLFWFGFTTYPNIHWIVPIIGSGVFGLGTLLAFTGIFTFLVDAYPLYAASALAGNAFVRCTFAAAFPLFGIQMYEKLGYQWATGLLAFLTLAMLPFPYLFFRYGKKLRARSRFATAS